VRQEEKRSGALLGALLAGGKSTRYGKPKALAPMAGRPMAVWPLNALKNQFTHVVLLSGDEELAQILACPHRGDRISGQGPLGGLVTALHWARELGLEGVFLLACDLPLVDGSLVARILAHGFRGRSALVPASPGPLGVEPLCAAYALSCLSPAEALLASGRRSMMDLLERVPVSTVPMASLGGEAAAARQFRNVNSPEDGRGVEKILRRGLHSRSRRLNGHDTGLSEPDSGDFPLPPEGMDP
jgi:molybdopterin-guanine dinucleotide biosynthesis protein A